MEFSCYKRRMQKVFFPAKIAAYLEYLEMLKGLKPITRNRYKRDLLRIRAELGKSFTLVEKGSEIEAAIIRVASKRKMTNNGGYMDDGRQARFRLGISAACFMQWAEREGHLPERNPYPKNTFPKPYRREAGFLTEEEVKIAYYSDKISIFQQLLISVYLDTGLRRAELCDIKIEDISFEERLVRVYSSKTDQYDRVPFTETTKERILYYLNNCRRHKSEYLISGQSGKLHPNSINQDFAAIEKVLGFRIHPRRLRHTIGSILIKKKPQALVMRHLRHVDPGMTNHYIHTTGAGLRDGLDEVHAAPLGPFVYAPKKPKEYLVEKN